MAVRDYRDSKRVRDAVGFVAYVAAAALGAYLVSLFIGHPVHTWADIFDKHKVSAIAATATGVLGKVLRWRVVVPIPDDTAREVVLGNAASELADFLYRQASAELERRDLGRSALMDVRWQPMVQAPGAGGRGTPRLVDHGPRVRTPLAGVAARFVADGMARVVVVGGDASGKSALVLHLQRGLMDLTVDKKADPAFRMVPVLLPLSGWNPKESLEAWAAARLRDIHPALAFSVRYGRRKMSIAEALLTKHRILLILDGLDEIHESVRWEAFVKVDSWLGRGLPLIVSCREDSFTEWLAAMIDVGRTDADGEPAGARIIRLLPPEQESVDAYLRYSAAANRTQDIWDVALAHDGEPLALFREAWRTPLMVWLTERIFGANPRRFARLVGVPEADLRPESRDDREQDRGEDLPALATRMDVEDHLLDNLVRVAILHDRRERPPRPRLHRMTSEHAVGRDDEHYARRAAERWLPFLADWITDDESEDLEVDRDATRGIAWWQLARHRRVRRIEYAWAVLMALLSGAAVAFGVGCAFWRHHGHATAVVWAAAFGVVSTAALGWLYVSENPSPKSQQLKTPTHLGEPLLAGAIAAVVAGAAGGVLSDSWAGTLAGPLIGALIATAYAFSSVYVDPEKVASALALYRSDQQHTFIFSVVYGAALGPWVMFYYGWLPGLVMGLLAGSVGGFSYGLIELAAYRRASTGLVAWLRFRIAHFQLWRAGDLPGRLFRFLDDMHRLGILRQFGAHYQFNHARLREQLARDYRVQQAERAKVRQRRGPRRSRSAGRQDPATVEEPAAAVP